MYGDPFRPRILAFVIDPLGVIVLKPALHRAAYNAGPTTLFQRLTMAFFNEACTEYMEQ